MAGELEVQFLLQISSFVFVSTPPDYSILHPEASQRSECGRAMLRFYNGCCSMSTTQWSRGGRVELWSISLSRLLADKQSASNSSSKLTISGMHGGGVHNT